MIWLTTMLLLTDPTITGTETPADVAQWVATDLATLPVEDREFQRYVWVPSWSDERWHASLTFTVNAAASRAGTLQQPAFVANGWLQRWDLRTLVQNNSQLNTLTATWDSIQSSEPYFHDRTTGRLSESVAAKLEKLGPLGDIGCPVYRADWLLVKMLSAIDGNKYLEFRGLADVQPTKDNPTAESVALSRFGVFETQAVAVDGDRRVATFFSGVTGKARATIQLNGFNGSAWITEDLFDEDTDVNNHPIYNLLNNKPRGHEIIVEMPNGLHAFLITDDQGRILREAPPELVADHQVPAPYTRRLDGGAISCVRCHGQEAGLRSCSNDIATLLAGPLGVLDDLSTNGTTNAADEIATRYSGRKFERNLRRGREDYEAAIDELTGGQLNAQQIAELVSEVFAYQQYELVTPTMALKELGFNINPDGKPIVPGAIFAKLVEIDTSGLEGPSIGALMVGIPIRRPDFDRIFSTLSERTQRVRAGR